MALDLASDYYQQRRRIVQSALGICLASAVFITGALFVLLSPVHAAPADDFVTTWKTDNPGGSNSSSITIPWHYNYTYNYDVDWNNDGVFDQFGITSDVTHDFGTPGTYTIRIRGTYPYMQFSWNNDDDLKLVDINQWGTGAWESMKESFSGVSNMTVTATDAPNLSNVTDMYGVFSGATSFNGDISGWDTSNVTDMTAMFTGASAFNRSLSAWDTSNVTSMQNMFSGATSFNGDISGWDTSNVTDMIGMFYNASVFNQDISGWDTSNTTNMRYMFANATSFDQNLGTWDMSSVSDVVQMLGNSGLSSDNYDSTLIGWAAEPLQSGLWFDPDGLSYCTAGTQRQSIIDTFGWTISGDTKACSLYLNNGTSASIQAELPIGTNIGTLTVDNFALQPASPYSLACATPGPDDQFFTVGGVGSDKLLSNTVFHYDTPSDTGGNNVYDVCIRATNVSGQSIDQMVTITALPEAAEKEITGVGFSEVDGKKLLTITGTGMVGETDQNEYSEALTRSLVKLNGVDLPFCADRTGLTAQEFVDLLSVDPSLVSDDSPCYYLFDGPTGIPLITPTQAQIWLPDNFDITAPGTVSVNDSNTFAFNSAPGDPVITAEVNNESLSGTPTILKRPTFNGSAPEGSVVTVTVHSDPISCTTTADSNGNWSCILPSDLAPGDHTVFITVVTPSDGTFNLGPYTVRVAGETITNNTPLAPNTGFQRTIASFAWVVAAICGVIVVGLIATEFHRIRNT